MYINGDPEVSWYPDTLRFDQGVPRNGSILQDLIKLPVIAKYLLFICVQCLIRNSICDTNKCTDDCGF